MADAGSAAVVALTQSCHFSPTSPTAALRVSSPRPSPQGGENVAGADYNAAALDAASAATLIPSLSVRRLVDGVVAKGGLRVRMPSSTFFQLVVFGLVSSLLAVAMQTQASGTQFDAQVGLQILILASISIAHVHQRCSWHLEPASPSPSGALPKPTSVDDVKTKIQCSVPQRLRTFVSRLSASTLSPIKVQGQV